MISEEATDARSVIIGPVLVVFTTRIVGLSAAGTIRNERSPAHAIANGISRTSDVAVRRSRSMPGETARSGPAIRCAVPKLGRTKSARYGKRKID